MDSWENNSFFMCVHAPFSLIYAIYKSMSYNKNGLTELGDSDILGD